MAFFSPFDTTRYFFTMRPVAVSPIGVSEFFTEYGLQVLVSEAEWIWLPSSAVRLALRTIQRMKSGKVATEPSPPQ